MIRRSRFWTVKNLDPGRSYMYSAYMCTPLPLSRQKRDGVNISEALKTLLIPATWLIHFHLRQFHYYVVHFVIFFIYGHSHASFTPLVLSATGGKANGAITFYKRLASCLATKWDQPYGSTMSWLRCRLTFSLLRSAIQCIRRARSSCGHATN